MSEKSMGGGSLILLAAAPLLFTLCSRTEELLPDTSLSDQKTVTITIRGSEAIAGHGTKTTLEEDGRVIWNEGDWVNINYQEYQVIPNPDDPAMATVEGVAESLEYVAYVGRGGGLHNDYYALSFPYYYSYGESFRNMPMMAYSTDTNLEFKNIGGVLRLGMTGTQTLERISLATNDGSGISGSVRVPVEDFRSGELKDSYADFEYSDGVTIIEFYYDSEEEFITLDPSTPEYFNFCIPSRVYENGFTVIAEDIYGNIARKKVTAPVEVLRSTLVPMETFAFEPLPEPVIEVTETTDSTITFTVTAEPGMEISAGAVYGTLYESLPECSGYFEEDYCRNDYALEAADFGKTMTAGEDGTCTFRLSEVCNAYSEIVKMSAGTDYYVTAVYSGWDWKFGNPAAVKASTTEAVGEGPEFSVEVLADSSTYTNMVMRIVSSDDLSGLSVFVCSQKEYESYAGMGMDDTDIAQIYGRALDGDKVVEASQPSGLVYGSVEIESCLLYPSAEFTAIVLATGYDSSTSVQRVQYATPEHFPQEPVWETVSANAEMQIYFSYYHEDGSYESFNPSYSGLLEKSADAAIYRMAYEPESDSEFVKAMEISGLMREGRGTVYLYLDATECDLTGSTAGNYITRIFPEESYTGFCTADSRPAYFATSKNSVSYFPVYSYDPEIVSISVSSNVTADIDGESRILLASINISYQLSGSASGLYTEQFYVKDRTPW